MNWFRLHKFSSGCLLIDSYGTDVGKSELNKQGYFHYLKEMKNLIKMKIGSKNFGVIASPAEIDYLFPFLLSHVLKKRFVSVHISKEWPTYLTRFRYNNIQSGDRVLLVAVILTSALSHKF